MSTIERKQSSETTQTKSVQEQQNGKTSWIIWVVNYFSKMKKWEKLYFFLTWIVILSCTAANFNLQTFRDYCDKNNYTYIQKRNKFIDVCTALVIVGGLRLLVRFKGHDAIQKILKPGNDETNEIRCSKVSKWLFDIVYYFLMQVFAFCVFRENGWYPALLGGAGTTDTTMQLTDYPDFPKCKGSEWMELYYSIHFGNITFTALELLFIRRKEDQSSFWEWMTHHVLATFLVVFSFNYNLFIEGIIVLIIHDVADVTVPLMKLYTDSKYNKQGGMFIFLVVLMETSWIFSRNYLFCVHVLYPYYYNMAFVQPEVWAIIKYAYTYQVGMLFFLEFMHCYWCGIMLFLTYKTLTLKKETGKVQYENNFDYRTNMKESKNK